MRSPSQRLATNTIVGIRTRASSYYEQFLIEYFPLTVHFLACILAQSCCTPIVTPFSRPPLPPTSASPRGTKLDAIKPLTATVDWRGTQMIFLFFDQPNLNSRLNLNSDCISEQRKKRGSRKRSVSFCRHHFRRSLWRKSGEKETTPFCLTAIAACDRA